MLRRERIAALLYARRRRRWSLASIAEHVDTTRRSRRTPILSVGDRHANAANDDDDDDDDDNCLCMRADTFAKLLPRVLFS